MWNIYYLFNCEIIKFIFTKTKMSKINKNVSKLIVINYLTVKYKHLKPGNMLLEYLVAVIIIFKLKILYLFWFSLSELTSLLKLLVEIFLSTSFLSVNTSFVFLLIDCRPFEPQFVGQIVWIILEIFTQILRCI